MKSFLIATFSQANFLGNEKDPDIAGGICVALCNLWLQSILRKPKVEPQHRMQFLAAEIEIAKKEQKTYGGLRAQYGRNQAREMLGQARDVGYDHQTTVMHSCVGKPGIRAKVAADLRAPGSAAAWSMRFSKGGGHAIAGVNRFDRITENVAHMHVNVFDPNIGEYFGPFAGLSAIIDDLFNKHPVYATTIMLHRAEAIRA